MNEISARDVFASARTSVWMLRAMAPGGTVLQGSAIAVSSRHLLTTCHLVSTTDSAEISQGSARRAVSVVLRDQRTDRCILAVAEPTLRPVRAVRPFRQLGVGERVYTVSAPAGRELTLGEGLVSSLHPSPTLSIIQTTAPMSLGSSGGALFDARGNLIGVVAFRAREVRSLGFAIAAEDFWTLR
ncbi:S1 family peptidase [Roseococcus pinisoli]|uniref:Trypsin-like peptidase domain-containing protein n=1 Tax=Roseococcus pinisoli TaxID=2835040 RepID=A0ABS5QFA3_9PROT|nr:serine protease [Roseococcus pinisoli]MBS7811610.1 trypsin-like peptidase domain-containing protein [Roseococcus pinisoli]